MQTLVDKLIKSKLWFGAAGMVYAWLNTDPDLMKFCIAVYSGTELGQNLYSMKKNGTLSGDTKKIVDAAKNLLEKQDEVVNPCTDEQEATLDDSGASQPEPAIETEAQPEPAVSIKPVNIELVLDVIKKNLAADLVPINPEIVSMKFHEWVLRNWDNIPGFDQARVLDYAIGLAREHYRIVVGDTAPMTGEDMVNYNQFLADIQPQLTEKYGCGKYPAERVRVAVMDLRGLYNFKGEVSL